LSDFIHPDDRQRALCEFARLIGRRRTTYDGVGRLLDAWGEVHWVSVHASLMSAGTRELLRVRALALPLRPLSARDADDHRTSSNDRLSVALDVGLGASRIAA